VQRGPFRKLTIEDSDRYDLSGESRELAECFGPGFVERSVIDDFLPDNTRKFCWVPVKVRLISFTGHLSFGLVTHAFVNFE
jgi:hypothetical protein